MKEKSTVRYRIIKNKRKPLCDYEGKCKNLAYKEVYPCLVKNYVLKHLACLVLEHAPKCFYFRSIKINRLCREHFGHLGGKHKNRGWSYLCKKHFIQEKKKFKKLPYASI